MKRSFVILLIILALCGSLESAYINTASKVAFYAWDTTANAPKTGDAGNITAYVSIDGGAVTVLTDTSATEMSSTNAAGWYLFDTTAGEMNGNVLFFSAKTTTSTVYLRPVTIATLPTAVACNVTQMAGNTLPTSVANVYSDIITTTGSGTTIQTDDSGYVKMSNGTGTGQISITSGVVESNLTQIDGEAVPCSAAYAFSNLAGPSDVKTAMEADGSKLDHLWETTEDDGGVRRFTTNALEQAPTGGGTTQEIADAVRVEMEKAIDSDPNTGSLFERVKTMDDAYTAAKADYLDASIASRSTHDAAAVKTAMEADGSKLDHVWETTEDDGGVRRFTENALEEAPSGTGGDATAANQTTIISHLTDVKGTGFVKDTSSLPQCLTATSVTVSDKTGFSLTSAYDAAKTAYTPTSTVNGVTLDSLYECLLAFMAGKATVNDQGDTRVITFYKRNGTSAKFTITASKLDGGSRAATGTIYP